MLRAVHPEVAAAVQRLVRNGVLQPEGAAPLLRQARGELVSLRAELRILAWAGVTLLMAGVALLVHQNLDRIGPLAIASALAVGAAACLWWVALRAPAFAWTESPSPHLAFDYILLLGVLLIGADIAFIEVQYAPLGGHWPSHLLLTAILAVALAVRFDSRPLFSLGLSTLAAWRGVTASTFDLFAWNRTETWVIRLNAIACGAAFVVLGAAMVRLRRKPHFEPVATYLGWGLVLGALLQGTLQNHGDDGSWPLWAVAAMGAGLALAAGAWVGRRLGLFAMGVLAVYVGASRLALETIDHGATTALYFVLTGAAVLALLGWAQRRLREEA